MSNSAGAVLDCIFIVRADLTLFVSFRVIKSTLDHCWEKAKQENKEREKNYNPFNEPQKDLLAEFEKIKKEHAEKESEE